MLACSATDELSAVPAGRPEIARFASAQIELACRTKVVLSIGRFAPVVGAETIELVSEPPPPQPAAISAETAPRKAATSSDFRRRVPILGMKVTKRLTLFVYPKRCESAPSGDFAQPGRFVISHPPTPMPVPRAVVWHEFASLHGLFPRHRGRNRSDSRIRAATASDGKPVARAMLR